MSNLRLGYFTIKKIEDKYIGGILVIDEFGMPIDFKYTEPVSPTPLQTAIYGSSIESYLKDKIITKSLFKEINEPVSICFSEIDEIEILGQFVKLAVGVSTTLLSSEMDEGNFKQIKANEYLIAVNSLTNPVRLVFQDLPPSKILNGLELIKLVTKSFNIVEPFARLVNAFEIICSK